MFGKRNDGKLVTDLDAIAKMMPLLMPTRTGAQNYFLLEQDLTEIDKYIETKEKEGETYTYMHILSAILVRVFKMYPRLNRFITNKRIYQRNKIEVSVLVKKSLREVDGEELVKPEFTGYETLAEVKEKIDSLVKEIINMKDRKDNNVTGLDKLPFFLLKLAIWFMKWSDKHGFMPKSLMQSSPFHCSIFFTNLKSLHVDRIYHHLYDFGNCGFFVAMGKEKTIPMVNSDGKVVPTKVLPMGISMDERYIDGYYYSKVLKTIKRMLANPEILDKPLSDDEIFKK